MVIFGTKPWINPFGKIPIFRRFEVLIFISQKGVFSFQNIVEDLFVPYIAPPPKKWKNGHFWTKSMVLPIWKNVNIHGVNPWFWSKNGPFSNFFFQAIQHRKMSLTIFQNEKTPFQAIKTTTSKSRKIDIFPKGLIHGFGPKMAIFPTFLFRQFRS